MKNCGSYIAQSPLLDTLSCFARIKQCLFFRQDGMGQCGPVEVFTQRARWLFRKEVYSVRAHAALVFFQSSWGNTGVWERKCFMVRHRRFELDIGTYSGSIHTKAISAAITTAHGSA